MASRRASSSTGRPPREIFLGTITKWNDPAIATLNPDMTLPNTPIQVVHRSDESGTTFVFTSWLAAESTDWETQVGADKAVHGRPASAATGTTAWPPAIGQTEGAIGYLSYDFAVASNLGIAQVKSDDGAYVTPSIESITAAGGSLKFPIQPTTNILNSSAPGAYPISTTTYLLLYTDQTDKNKAQTIFDFVLGAHERTGDGEQLNYAPLPPDIASAGPHRIFPR